MKNQSITNATAILRHDHKAIERLFNKYDQTNNQEEKEDIVRTISLEFHLHCNLEEELFYPAVNEILNDKRLIDSGMKWHHQINLILHKLERIYADQDKRKYDTEVAELKKCFKNYVKTEEEQLISKVESTQLDLAELSKKIDQRKALLTTPTTNKQQNLESEITIPCSRMQPEPSLKEG